MYIDISCYDKEFDEQMYEIATNYRNKYAIKFAEKYLNNQERVCASSFLAEIVERKPFENCEQSVCFTRYLNEIIIADILLSEELDIIEKISILQYVIELSAREFINPFDLKKFGHLAASKTRGYFFTPPSLAIRMVKKAIEENKDAVNVIDPACGAGIFLSLYVLLNPNIKNITGVEIDSSTATYAKTIITSVAKECGSNVNIEIIQRDFFDYYDENKQKYDCVIMNPPYGNLKFMESDLLNTTTIARLDEEQLKCLQEEIRRRTKELSSRLKKQFSFSGLSKGVLEVSKLFLAATINMLNTKGIIVAITPSTWLGDDNSSDFRKYILCTNSLRELWNFDEAAKMFRLVNQPTTVSIIGTNRNGRVKIYNNLINVHDLDMQMDDFSTEEILSFGGSKYKIAKCSNEGMAILKKIYVKKRLSQYDYIANARGELDLSLYRKFVSKKSTGYRLIRGDHVDGVRLRNPEESDKDGFVDYDGFISCCTSERKELISGKRIAIPQCSYLKKRKRIESCIVDENTIISNSCNFLAVENSKETELVYIYAWINSSVIEWYFRSFSYNNHVANYEISDFPYVSPDEMPAELKCLLYRAIDIQNPDKSNWELIDVVWAKTFNLTQNDYERILHDIGAEYIDKRILLYNEVKFK